MIVLGEGPPTIPKRHMSERARADVMLLFDRWGFDARGWSAKTRYRYATRVKAADRWLREMRSISVVWASHKDLSAYLFSTKPTPQTRNDIRQALVGFGDFLVASEWREDNPATALPRLTAPRSIPKALDLEQARRLSSVAQHFSEPHHALILLMLYGGLRRDEARTLQWHQVGEKAAWVTIIGKGNKERQVPLHRSAADVLMGWKLNCPSPTWVFPGRYEDRPMSPTSVNDTVKMIGSSAGLPDLHPHALRHTVATRMLEQTGDLRAVQVFLGHSRPETTAIYTKVRPAKLKEASDKLDFGR